MISSLLIAVATKQLGAILYGGVPSVKNASLTQHQVIFNIKDDHATVDSNSRLVVGSDGIVTINIPMSRQGVTGNSPALDVPNATVDDSPLVLRAPLSIRDEDGTVTFTGNVSLTAGNHTLHVRYQTSAARTGLGHKQRTFGYAMTKGPEISRLEFIYHYDQGTVFNVPDMEPADWGWQTGKTGAYMKKENFQPGGETVFMTYYTAKVEDEL